MRYGITKLVLGRCPFITISENDYITIKSAKDSLLEALYLEQKLDLVIEDYLEYEMTLLSYSASKMLFHNFNYMRFHNETNNINRRIVNLLSACRLYLDHCIHHLKNIYGNTSNKIDLVRNQKRNEYDSNLSFRVMEALRNYVQHRGFPIQKVKYNASRIDNKDDHQFLYSVTPYLKIKELEEDKKFKKTVLKELKKLGDEIDIKPLTREYITSIGNVHKKVREVINNDVQLWDKIIHECIQKFQDGSDAEESILGLGIVRQEEEGIYSESVPIFTEFIELRQELEQKNRLVGSLAKCFVTNQVVKR